jgi:uncharacterized protein (TIGR00369 family)
VGVHQDFRYGVASRDEIMALTGRELLQAIVDGKLPQALASQSLSFWLVEVGEGTAAFEGETGAHLLNPAGSVHGGWALTLIDSAAACAGHSLLPAGVGYTTIETKANFTRAILKDTGRVRAEGRVIAQGRQVITCEATVRGGDGKVLAHGTSTLMVLRPR